MLYDFFSKDSWTENYGQKQSISLEMRQWILTHEILIIIRAGATGAAAVTLQFWPTGACNRQYSELSLQSLPFCPSFPS